MNNFENYDLRRWQEGGLSLHPRSSAKVTASKPERRFSVANVFVPLVAVGSMLTMESVRLPIVDGPGALRTSNQTRSQYPASRHESVYWLGTVKHTAESVDPLTSFEANALELARQIRTGGLVNVSAETLRLARITHDRDRMGSSQDNKWIDDIAYAVAQLTD